ncbi:MAG: ribosomal RNA small subunit methyltransferase A [Alphaproteobacteria bacterium GM7ARS4]|nr:ribosomal RNA small subunit methyltransferase A [Alphaproteobacteria bacterium GM7ARS4]
MREDALKEDTMCLPSSSLLRKAYGVIPRPHRGQHFLLNDPLLLRIARAALPLTHAVVFDIGAGIGSLSRALLLLGARHVYAVENDRRCLDALTLLSSHAQKRMTVLADDVLRLDIPQLARRHRLSHHPLKIVANIPYHLSSPLLAMWLRESASYGEILITAQKELVSRLHATAGRDYGRLSVAVQRVFHVKPLFMIHRRNFMPPPKVDSQLVMLRRREKPQMDVVEADLDKILRLAFGMRRKMLATSLAGLEGGGARLCADANIDGTLRPQDVPPPCFYRLAQCYTASLGRV